MSLDVLRGAAILMVLVCHSAVLSVPTWDIDLWRPCWSGVDLFFVISGFLISGLLFAEFKKMGNIRFPRFAVRRALKLYPAFYVVVLITIAVRLEQHRYYVWRQALHDLLFVQSYFLGTWGHFWSLSVEEHFYILLPLLMYCLIRFSKSNQTNPFRAIPTIFAILGPAILILRLWTAQHMLYSLETNSFPTHLRIDSLFFGVVISYFYQFHEARFTDIVNRWRLWIFASSLALLAPMFFIGQYDRWMYTYGFSCLYLGYGLLLIGMVQLPLDVAPKPLYSALGALAYIGTFSYSIYLWHGFASTLASWVPSRFVHARLVSFYVGAILIGVITSKLLELPVLRFRDYIFPSSVSPVRVSTPVAAAKFIEENIVRGRPEDPVNLDCHPSAAEANSGILIR
jgi:peptidoglycan/LPS O-acetylase OafA/YrhL